MIPYCQYCLRFHEGNCLDKKGKPAQETLNPWMKYVENLDNEKLNGEL
jgi:hypothetical protein